MEGAPGDEVRTRLANERTYLAWWRTGVAAFAVSLASGRLIPALTSGTTWPYTVIGVGFAVLGIACTGYAFSRPREVEPSRWIALLLSYGGAALGLLLLVVLIVQA